MLLNRLLPGGAGVAAALVTHAAFALPTKDECINANEAAQSLRTAGKLREAAAQLNQCMAATCPRTVRDDCAERLNELQRALPTVAFDVRGADGSSLSAVRVSMDGVLLVSELRGSAIPVDPGKHAFSFAADGFMPVEQPILILEGDKERVERVVLRRTDGTAGADAAVGSSPARVGAFAAAGVGLAGLVVGGVFGALALRDKASLSSHCSINLACPSNEQSEIQGLHTSAAIADVGFGVAIAGLVTSTILYLVWRGGDHGAQGASSRTWIGLGGAGVAGTFP